jgi:hypothetical protein|tara:strand:- start:391 stop:498 length:108 start_codon:yes stop_codon:yes gene_type:complete
MKAGGNMELAKASWTIAIIIIVGYYLYKFKPKQRG